MIFNSFPFVFFFAVFCLIYFSLPGKLRPLFLFLASVLFYYFFSPVGVAILAAVVVFNFYTGKLIEKHSKKSHLVISVTANIALLFTFKYFDFFSASATELLQQWNYESSLPLLHLLLPAGISFYTLQAIGYNIDIYHGLQEAEKNLASLATYFFFFPKIAQGPIERPRNLLPQLNEKPAVNAADLSSGIKLAVWGLFKKVVIADRLSMLVDNVYDHPHSFTGLSLLIAGIFYTFQLYADFSGYTDIAIGISRMMGYRLMHNFNHPFAATSVTDFWKRWHISFSTWLFEYIYNPLSLSKRHWRVWGMVYAVFITFLISGLWHGVTWIAVAWGGINGVALAYELLTAKARKRFWKKFPLPLSNVLSIAFTFSFTILSFTFARANNTAEGLYIVTHIFTGFKESVLQFMHQEINIHAGMRTFDFLVGGGCIFSILFVHLFQHRFNTWTWVMNRPLALRWSVYYLVMLGILWLGIYENRSFIYFQF